MLILISAHFARWCTETVGSEPLVSLEVAREGVFGIIGGGSVLAAAVTVGTLSRLPYVLPANTTAAVVSMLLVIIM